MTLNARLDGKHRRSRSDLVDHNSHIVENMTTEKGLSAHDEGVKGKRTFGQKVKRSCARFWWLYLLIFIAIVLVTVLPM